jgi:riboflavin kinase/FMN adenylyltransferase
VIAIESFTQVDAAHRGAFLAVGNFDGVHQGHAHLIGRLRARAAVAGAQALALTFDPQPVAILRPESAPVPLTWTERKVELLKQAGASDVVVFRTGHWLLDLTAREFFDRVVLGQFGARGIVEGPTFGFGRDRGGDATLLGAWCAEAGLEFEVASPAEVDGQVVSSSRIRRALNGGQVAEAAELLGRPHRVRGAVVTGAGRGAGLGFPTANLGHINTQVPSDGVYAAWAVLEPARGPLPAAVHVGPNATFGEQARQVEVHLIDFAGDLYGRNLQVDFVAQLRPTRKFAGASELLEQIRRDVHQARDALSRPTAPPQAP